MSDMEFVFRGANATAVDDDGEVLGKPTLAIDNNGIGAEVEVGYLPNDGVAGRDFVISIPLEEFLPALAYLQGEFNQGAPCDM